MSMPKGFGIKEVNVKYTLDEAINLILKIFSNTEQHLEIIIDHDSSCHLVDNSSILTLFRKLKLRNIDIKIVVEIDKKSAKYSKRLMKFNDMTFR